MTPRGLAAAAAIMAAIGLGLIIADLGVSVAALHSTERTCPGELP